ncbi:MAG: hypothetical protein CFH30_00559 [Alphaproteobacteria bacterium MarineAlpha8_Bin1]|nr:MAG: hypothetical protein CFH30_00559 [Alphaproteobacteria bacterium MarineAlpha8_Bin1]
MIIISPAKNLNLNFEDVKFSTSIPKFLGKTDNIVKLFKNLSISELKSLMKISDNLSKINYQRFQDFDTVLNNEKKPAILMFSGDTFNGLSFRNIDKKAHEYIQKNLRILTGLYGILRPFDVIKPYRLEMGTNTKKLLGSSLNEYWKRDVSESIVKDLKLTRSRFLFNLASNEYFSSIDTSKLNVQLVNFDFKRLSNNKLKNIGMMIKKLRGAMARFIIENQVKDLDTLKKFNFFGFSFENLDTKNNTFLFTIK